ncbi:RimJ/RimL family protein N-acetyltransferase [Idiomarina aquatica]|uniref:RimJ/RimL family protein N-acetyltransferase n=1 Tax=Idiomarina aquatica TaxID=1327752 RepID=A0A4R6PPA0_9GAMM|nr:GNAT family N-acetyltransferase [Idiomarina aquatica]TDP40525.1 RimJ/RimL family protein N-acetyltransferase [Idiomarina aquatica]
MIETERLLIKPLTKEDGAFILRLLNEPTFIENIADRGVRTQADAIDYIAKGPQASYRQYGIGLWKVELRDSGEAIGLAGLLQRDYLPEPDLGYALLPEFTGKGLAFEANQAVVNWAKAQAYGSLFAICNPTNTASIGLLYRLGFVLDGEVVPPGEAQPINRYYLSLT